MMRQPFTIHPRATIRSIDVKKIIESAESKPIARLEKWAAQTLRNRIEQAEAEAALQKFIELD